MEKAQNRDSCPLASPRREERECEVTASTKAEFEIGSNLDGDTSENVRSVSVDDGSGSSWISVEFDGRSAPRLLHTESADSPMPLFCTSSRAIAVSISSSPSMACKPSEANLPSIAKATSSFLPIKRRQTSCIVPL